jgi:hypothetical protein
LKRCAKHLRRRCGASRPTGFVDVDKLTH